MSESHGSLHSSSPAFWLTILHLQEHNKDILHEIEIEYEAAESDKRVQV